MSEKLSLQRRWAPNNGCFGCGPANDQGLRLASFVEGDEVVARFRPAPHHQAFGGVLNGGIIGTLLDCHSNWAAAHHLHKGRDDFPCTVTAEFHVKLKRPTPMDQELIVRARPTKIEGDKAFIEATLEATIKDTTKITATCTGLFVAVKEGHPAFHRW